MALGTEGDVLRVVKSMPERERIGVTTGSDLFPGFDPFAGNANRDTFDPGQASTQKTTTCVESTRGWLAMDDRDSKAYQAGGAFGALSDNALLAV